MKHEQLLFPFMTRYIEYVRDEVPYMKERYEEFKRTTNQHITRNEYFALHYCNPDSPFYEAEKYHALHDPLRLHDGYIMDELEYNRRTRYDG